jgi:nucleotide-binding universal stress UspA family protein
MDKIPVNQYSSAINDFQKARTRAFLKQIMGRITGESTELLSYDEVRHRLKAVGTSHVELKDIPLSAIIGSVGRYSDFTRDFMPKIDSIGARWASIKSAATGLTGLPPIEVYKIGEVFFVKDGNHRVSVARSSGATHISAYVTEVHSRIPISAEISADDLILKEEYINFLEKTRLDISIPDIDMNVTIPGQYPLIEEHISVHRYFMGIDQHREIPYEEAAIHWYNTYYLPIIQDIRKSGVLRYFPGRTATDMYIWLAEQRASLEKELGWQISTNSAINHFIKNITLQGENIFFSGWQKFLRIIDRSAISPGPPPGKWRKEVTGSFSKSSLFKEILVPVSGDMDGWFALDQAIIIAHKEKATIHGLHVVEHEEEKAEDQVQWIQEEFIRRCNSSQIEGTIAIAPGNVAQLISDRAQFTDLVITTLLYPPGPQPIDRLASGFRDLIQRCPRPVLAVPQIVSPLDAALLAYDGSAKADEALYIATYLAGMWKIRLVVLNVIENEQNTSKVLPQVQNYLRKSSINAKYVIKRGAVAENVMQVATENQCDFIIMGGYGNNPVLEVVLGSAVDQVLREANKPVLICR